MHANGNLTYKRQKIYHAGAKPQFNTDIEGKPNTLAGYGIGNFKVEEFRGNLNELKTDGIYAITQASRLKICPYRPVVTSKLLLEMMELGAVNWLMWHTAQTCMSDIRQAKPKTTGAHGLS